MSQPSGDDVSQSSGPAYGSGSRWLTVAQVSEWFGVSNRHVYGLVQANRIPYRRVGRSLRFPEQDLESWSKPTGETSRPTPSPHRISARPSARSIYDGTWRST